MLFGHFTVYFYSEGDYNRDTWIGGNDFEIEGEFRWSNGSPISGYTNWYRHNPDNLGFEHCVHFFKFFFQWNDNNCSKKFQSICEKELEEH